jgi:hypothetical protein
LNYRLLPLLGLLRDTEMNSVYNTAPNDYCPDLRYYLGILMQGPRKVMITPVITAGLWTEI